MKICYNANYLKLQFILLLDSAKFEQVLQKYRYCHCIDYSYIELQDISEEYWLIQETVADGTCKKYKLGKTNLNGNILGFYSIFLDQLKSNGLYNEHILPFINWGSALVV